MEKLALRIKVTDLKGNRITFGRSIARNLARILSHLTTYIKYILAAFTKKKQALQDILAECLGVDK